MFSLISPIGVGKFVYDMSELQFGGWGELGQIGISNFAELKFWTYYKFLYQSFTMSCMTIPKPAKSDIKGRLISYHFLANK